MTFAAIDWLSISINLLLVIFVIVCLLMTLLILMQRPKQEGLGAAFGGGVTDQVFGARTTNVLQRGTVYLGSLFFILALALAVLIGQKNKKISIVEGQGSGRESGGKGRAGAEGTTQAEVSQRRTARRKTNPVRSPGEHARKVRRPSRSPLRPMRPSRKRRPPPNPPATPPAETETPAETPASENPATPAEPEDAAAPAEDPLPLRKINPANPDALTG